MSKAHTIAQVKEFCNNLFSTPDYEEVHEAISGDEQDFTIGNVRFIHADVIDSVLAEEIGSDTYTLGCFTAWAIADATGWPPEVIEAAQEGDAHQKLGEAMTKEHIEKLAEIYSSSDGYGHHFNNYDGEELEFGKYHVFDNH